MIKIGITGQSGFIGSHLFNTLGLFPDKFERIEFKKSFFYDELELNNFVKDCDVIVHLAAINRHEDPDFLYSNNIFMVEKLLNSLRITNTRPHIIFSSSIQENTDNHYGNSKRKCRELFEAWSKEYDGFFTGLVIPNVFGPEGKPFYNSVIATFSYQLNRNEIPEIFNDSVMCLIYVGDLVKEILEIINQRTCCKKLVIGHSIEIRLSEILNLLKSFKNKYIDNNEIPFFKGSFELNLFNTFRSYIDHQKHFPQKLIEHKDNRGTFTEVLRIGSGGQISFSSTLPGVTRGNHYHTRKIERFTVIKGLASVKLRRIGSDRVMDFILDGDKPSFVDIPIWYVHNLQNIGKGVLYTLFWINEPYCNEDGDTYFENV